MKKKLRILLVFSKLEVSKHLIYIHRMHNLYAIFAKFLDICKQKAHWKSQVCADLIPPTGLIMISQNFSGNLQKKRRLPLFFSLNLVVHKTFRLFVKQILL